MMHENYTLAGFLILTALGAAMLFLSSDGFFALSGLIIGLYGIINLWHRLTQSRLGCYLSWHAWVPAKDGFQCRQCGKEYRE